MSYLGQQKPTTVFVERLEGGVLRKRTHAVGGRVWEAQRDDGRWARFTNRSAAAIFLTLGNTDHLPDPGVGL